VSGESGEYGPGLRVARRGDEEAIARLLGLLGYPASPDDVRDRILRLGKKGSARVVVATSDERVVGFAAVEILSTIHNSAPVCHVTALAVAPELRRRGIGRRLLEGIERLARHNGCRRVVVTSAERRTDAHSFYTANGWKYTGRRFGKQVEPSDDDA